MFPASAASQLTTTSTPMLQHILSGGEMLRSNPQYWAMGGATLVYWIGLAYYQGQSRKLRHIPTVGLTIPLLSYASAIRYVINAWRVVAEGMTTWKGRLFKVPGLFQWIVVAADRQSIEDVRKAPENVLSAMDAINESLQVEYTLGESVQNNPYHIPIIRAQLTRALPALVPEVRDELVEAFNDNIPLSDDWAAFPALETMMQVIARASNRVFVGLPLCRNQEYLDLNIKFTVQVMQAGALLRMVPKSLRSLANRWISSVDKSIRTALRHLEPIIEERRQMSLKMGKDYEGKPNDMLSWLMDEARGEETTNWFLTNRLLTINFAAIHTSSMTFTHALYYLAAYPEYIKPLRNEVDEVVNRLGWTKDALDEMHKIDSFIKESQRLHPMATILMLRVAVNDYTFSNGTTVPKGTTVGVSVTSTQYDEEAFSDALKFDPFRFSKLKEQSFEASGGVESKGHDFVSTGLNSLGFGHGRHACPGRYFASCELKMMLAHIVAHYDVKAESDGVRPPDMIVETACVPNPKAKVFFRKRMD